MRIRKPTEQDLWCERVVGCRMYDIYNRIRLERGLRCGAASAELGFRTYATMNNRFRSPKSLTLRELGMIAAAANITLEELIRMN